jgi:hypothetical protein
MAESFDAVLAEMRGLCKTYDAIGGGHAAQPIRDFANRLQAAHEREVVAAQARLVAGIKSFLAQQGNGEEKGNG